MRSADLQIEGFTLAVVHMDKMLNFYQNVFAIKFMEVHKYDAILYQGSLGGLKILLCPAEIARNTAKQNRHQFDIVVGDPDLFKENILKYCQYKTI